MRRAGAALPRATMGAGHIRSTVADSLPLPAQAAYIEGFLLGGYRTIGGQNKSAGITAALELTGVDARSVSHAPRPRPRAGWPGI